MKEKKYRIDYIPSTGYREVLEGTLEEVTNEYLYCMRECRGFPDATEADLDIDEVDWEE